MIASCAIRIGHARRKSRPCRRRGAPARRPVRAPRSADRAPVQAQGFVGARRPVALPDECPLAQRRFVVSAVRCESRCRASGQGSPSMTARSGWAEVREQRAMARRQPMRLDAGLVACDWRACPATSRASSRIRTVVVEVRQEQRAEQQSTAWSAPGSRRAPRQSIGGRSRMRQTTRAIHAIVADRGDTERQDHSGVEVLLSRRSKPPSSAVSRNARRDEVGPDDERQESERAIANQSMVFSDARFAR